MRVVTPTDAKGEYWLEAYPKFPQDQANFQRIEIILDEKDYLPKAMQVYDKLYDERSNWARSVFEFNDREWNWNTLLEELTPWNRHFSEPKTPSGWKKVVQPYAPPPVEEPPQRAPAGPVARKPAKKQTAPR